MSDNKNIKARDGSSKDIAAPATLGDVMLELNDNDSGMDRVRNVLAIRMNQYNDIIMTKMDVKKLAKAFQDIEVGATTNLVLTCSKENCLYTNKCPLYEDDRCPTGKECIHENYMLTFYMSQYLQSLDVDIENMPEMVLINQLVEYEVIENRCNAILSHAHSNLKWTRIVGLDKQGEIVEAEEVSYALTIKESVQKRKFQILQEFTATRREKYKKQAALKESKEGPAKLMSSLKAQIQAKKKQEVDHDEVKTSLLEDDDFDIKYEGLEEN